MVSYQSWTNIAAPKKIGEKICWKHEKNSTLSGNTAECNCNSVSRYAYPSVSAEKRLCRELMSNYSGLGLNGRPVINMSTPIVVSFSLGLINMDLDEKHKILISSMWSRYVRTFLFQKCLCATLSACRFLWKLSQFLVHTRTPLARLGSFT